MIIYKYIIILFCIGFFLQSCKKNPNAGICLSNENPNVFDTVELYSCSENTYTHSWILPDNSISSANNLIFTSFKEGSYKIKLLAYGKDKNDYDIDSVNVFFNFSSGNSGSIMFWTNIVGARISLKVYKQGGSQLLTSGSISTTYSDNNPPNCEAEGCYTVVLESGKTYQYTASMSPDYTWSGYITIDTNICKKLKLIL